MSQEREETGGGSPAQAREPSVTFNEALTELEAILERIESDDVDLDRLATELSRAAELLEVCRAKIRKAELEVSHIVEKLAGGEADASES